MKKIFSASISGMTDEEMFRQYRMLNPDATDYSWAPFTLSEKELCCLDLGRDWYTGAIAEEIVHELDWDIPGSGEIQAFTTEDLRQCLFLAQVQSVTAVSSESLISDECDAVYSGRGEYFVIRYRIIFR